MTTIKGMNKIVLCLVALACLGAAKLRSPKDETVTKGLAPAPLSPPLPALVTRGPSPGPSVVLAWNASIDTNVVSYNVYYGVASRTYTNLVSVGNVLTCTIGHLLPGRIYYFAATALSGLGLESDYSNEISYHVPGVIPPTNYIVSVTVQQSQDMTNWTTATNLAALSFTNATGVALYWRALMNIQAQ